METPTWDLSVTLQLISPASIFCETGFQFMRHVHFDRAYLLSVADVNGFVIKKLLVGSALNHSFLKPKLTAGTLLIGPNIKDLIRFGQNSVLRQSLGDNHNVIAQELNVV